MTHRGAAWRRAVVRQGKGMAPPGPWRAGYRLSCAKVRRALVIRPAASACGRFMIAVLWWPIALIVAFAARRPRR
ncbi:hypothetical protein Skr01_10620 [Sphaerisporangium krabiense]|nr:hypothetical protein Skr01_10620 [Sphaerisporangium krabiense]